jgi:hypothetical protein
MIPWINRSRPKYNPFALVLTRIPKSWLFNSIFQPGCSAPHHPHLLKESIKYAACLLAFILVSYGLSWFAVYGYWISAFTFHSVSAVRICEAVGAVILLPVRVVFWTFSDLFDQSAPLSDPTSYAAVNAVLLGAFLYVCCRAFLFGGSPASDQGKP